MGRHARPLALLAVVALAGGLSACGADDELSTQIPKTSPDLTIPTGTTPARADATTPATTTTQTTTTEASGAVTPPAAAAALPAAPPPAAATGSPQTGGQAPQTGGQSTTGGTSAGGGEFQNFCSENPGAC